MGGVRFVGGNVRADAAGRRMAVIRLPVDYFAKRNEVERPGQNGADRCGRSFYLKNLAGVVLLLAGLVMLVAPDKDC